MAIVKPSVAGKSPIVITGSGFASNANCEVVAFHYLNTTSGAGRINVREGGAGGEIRVVLGGDAANSNDDFCPAQPMKFSKCYIEFATGTGVVTVLMN